MEVMHPRCAGLDVHKDTVVACVRLAADRKVEQEVRTFRTTTRELCQLFDWLAEHGCTHVAMEATGVYWKPVWHVLDGSFELVLANAGHIRNVPGRKTDVRDAEWIADLLAHGLIRASFVPPEPVQEMRDLTRTRKQLVREVAQHVQRVQKALEDANLKLTGTISNVVGVDGRKILQAVIDGESDPKKLADLATHVKASRKSLIDALHGNVRPHHRFLLKLHLQQIDSLQQAIAEVEQRLGAVLEPFRRAVRLLTTIPGVSETVANVLVAEIGIDMNRFPSAAHLVSWAGLCPRNDESAGKRRSTRLRHGDTWLKTALVQAGWAAGRSKGTYLNAQFLRIKSRRGPRKAVVALAASILVSAYHILREQVPYKDLGPQHFDRQNKTRTIKRLVRRLRDLGCDVQIPEVA